VAVTHPDKVYFPGTGFTKADLIRYYAGVSRHMLPHLRDRPVTLIRFPDGVTGKKFYEKNAPAFTPAWVRTVRVPRRHEGGAIRYLVINDADTLTWCANLGAIEIHPFLHAAPNLGQPTHIAFDLDPGDGSTIATCSRVALLVREILAALGLKGFPKVSGSKGLQVYVPLNSGAAYGASGAFAKAVAELLARDHPDLVVSTMSKAVRRGRVLIDWSQNSPSKTTVGVYSVRGKGDSPTVSMPVTWQEVEKASKGRRLGPWSPSEALGRLRKSGDLFAPVLKLRQRLPRAFAGAGAPKASPLSAYEGKRDFSRTSEPRPSRGPRKGGRFVIQKHAATHLHYDFRLEMDGVLKSWAVPKGLPTQLGVKRSGFAVEDHPVGYIKFEGTIPKGQYGGGTVMVWDFGTYELLAGSVGSGSLKFILKGSKLRGEWHMFKIRSEAGKDVWLIAKSHEDARPVSARRDDASALTGRSMARIAGDNDATWRSRAA
jgi:bifunctional non-homologous end joining protein LigD